MSPCTAQSSFQEGKNSRITVRFDDWLGKALGDFDHEGNQVLLDGAWNVQFDLDFSSELVDIDFVGTKVKPAVEGKKVVKGIADSVKELGTRIERSQARLVNDLIELVRSALKEEAEGDNKAYERAKKGVDNANKALKSALGDLRSQCRALIKKQLVKAKDTDIRTNGLTSLKEIRIANGVFDSEVDLESDELEDFSDLLNRKKNKWLYFAMATTANAGYMSVSRKRPIKKLQIKEIKKESDEVPDNAKLYQGILKYAKPTIEFRFVGGSPSRKALKEVVKLSATKCTPCKPMFGPELKSMPSDLKSITD